MKKLLFSLFLLVAPILIGTNVFAKELEKTAVFLGPDDFTHSFDQVGDAIHYKLNLTSNEYITVNNYEIEINEQLFKNPGTQIVFDLEDEIEDSLNGYTYLRIIGEECCMLPDVAQEYGTLLVLEVYKDYYILGIAERYYYTELMASGGWIDYSEHSDFMMVDKGKKFTFFLLDYNLNQNLDIDKKVFYTSVQNPATIETIESKMTPIDRTSTFFFLWNNESTYTNDVNQVGDYLLDICVSDSPRNWKRVNIIVKVRDTNPLFINGSDYLYTSDSVKLSKADIISRYNVTDYNNLSVDNEIVVDDTDYNNYASQYNVVGIYSIKLSTTNGYTTTNKTITIKVIDKTPPSIKYDANLFFEADLHQELSLEQIINLLQSQGLLASGINLENYRVIHSDYDPKKVGSYQILLEKTNQEFEGENDVLLKINVTDKMASSNPKSSNLTIYIILSAIAGVSLIVILGYFGIRKIKAIKQTK